MGQERRSLKKKGTNTRDRSHSSWEGEKSSEFKYIANISGASLV